MQRALERLVSAIGCGSALAALSVGGCGGETTEELQPYSQDALTCTDGCCLVAHCYEPESGAACLPVDGVGRAQMPSWPSGSGTCRCGDGRAFGPFAPNPSHEPLSPGRCCYLVGRVGCDGRPFLIDAVAMVAPVVRRNDWA